MSEAMYAGPMQRWVIEFGSANKAANAPERLLRGEFELAGPGASTFDPDDMPWDGNEERHPSWNLWLHSLKWLDRLIPVALDFDDPQATPEARLALQIVHSWAKWNEGQDRSVESAWHGHPTALRLTTLLAVGQVYPTDEVVHSLVLLHVEHLVEEENFDGYWNHGLVQSIALLGAGLQLGRRDVTDIARVRIGGCLDEMIDEEGAINEQAPGYSQFIYSLFSVVERIYTVNAMPGRSRLRDRLRKLEDFVVHSTRPDGTFVQLGDTAREPGPVMRYGSVKRVSAEGIDGTPPTRRSAVFARGYAFARSGWGTERPYDSEDYFSLRFGPQRIIHGHNDHTSVTWMHEGHDIVVDSGHGGYAPGAYRNFLRSVEAHNVVVVDGERHDWSASTTLTRHESYDTHEFFEVEDRGYPSVRRARSVAFVPGRPMLVVDRLLSDGVPRLYRQLWHLAPELQLTRLSEGLAILERDGEGSGVALAHFRSSAGSEAQGAARYWRGSENPVQGWISYGPEKREKNPVVEFTTRGSNAMLVTVLIPHPHESVGVTHEVLSDGWNRFVVRNGDETTAFRVSARGYVSVST